MNISVKFCEKIYIFHFLKEFKKDLLLYNYWILNQHGYGNEFTPINKNKTFTYSEVYQNDANTSARQKGIHSKFIITILVPFCYITNNIKGRFNKGAICMDVLKALIIKFKIYKFILNTLITSSWTTDPTFLAKV